MIIIKRYYKVTVWIFIIAYLCFVPSDEFKKVHITIPHFDKIVHWGMFFILGLFLVALKFKKQKNIYTVMLYTFAVSYGGIIEIIQTLFIYSRNGDIIDWIADIAGIFSAVLIFKYIPVKIKMLLG
jgi:VanZ family protein